ncbi:MAG: sigma-70 family RNA polymerase sigma factor [Myxococcales bacterium]
MGEPKLDFEALFRDHRSELVRFLGRLVGEADADDVAQGVMTKALAALPTFRGESSPRTWLFRIATNAARDFRRSRAGQVQEPADPPAAEEEVAAESADISQERRLVREEMSRCVGEFLERLPESYRTVLALSDCEELSDKEIAAVLGTSVGAAKIRLHRARARLKQELEAGCSFYRDDENVLCCDRKEPPAEPAYRLQESPRLQVGSAGSKPPAAGPADHLHEEHIMATAEILPTKQKQLIGVGAGIAAGCQPCTRSFAKGAKEAGACERGTRLALEAGLAARANATQAMTTFAWSEFAHPELDAAFRAERATLESLIGVAAAIAANSAALVGPSVTKALGLGATADQIRVAAEIGRAARRGAEREADNALTTALGGKVESAACCAPGTEAPAGGCGCGADPVPTAAGGGQESAESCGCQK